MRATKTKFIRKPLAAAVMCSAIGLSPAVFGATVESINTDNMSVPPVEGKTLIYTDTAGTETFGWLDPVNDSGEVGLGISVYNEIFDAAGESFQGCIMAQTDLEPDPEAPQNQQDSPNCLAPGDSGKRFKLKTTKTNGPIDIVLNVTADSDAKLYRVIGKFSNLTGALNAVGGDLQAFRFETGFGVGNEFIGSSAEDGLSFGMQADGSAKLSVGALGKFPGGLFGGSKVEGLPFFSTSVAAFTESDATAADEDTIETDGAIPAEYGEAFGDWRALSQVPTGWFIDHDGNPANDSILLAVNFGSAEVPVWNTFEKIFNSVDVQAITTTGETVTAPATVYDPNGDSFGTYTDTSTEPATIYDIDVSNVQPLVDTLEERDAAGTTPDAISLDFIAASILYEGTFEVLIDGEGVPIADFETWAENPVTILDEDPEPTQPVFATWDPEALDGEGGYLPGNKDGQAYNGTAYDFEVADADGDGVLSLTEVAEADPSIFADTLARQPGYVQGAVEDLANVNINTSVAVSDTSTWPTCTGDGTETNCTFTLRVTGLNDAVEEPVIPPSPVVPEPEPEPEEPSASSSDGDGTIFGCTAGKPGSPFDPVLPSMVLMALAGLWARKRRGTA